MIDHKGRRTRLISRSQTPGEISMITGSCKERIKAKMPQLTETEKKLENLFWRIMKQFFSVMFLNWLHIPGYLMLLL